MCHFAVNWCDKVCLFFCIYICCFIANFGYRKGQLVNGHAGLSGRMTGSRKRSRGAYPGGADPLADSDRKRFQIRLELKKYVHNKA